MRSIPVATVAVALLVSFMSNAQKISVPFEKYRLDNGLTVILHQDHRLPTVAVNLWYHVGAKDEPKGRSGFAHLFEHLMFMGTHRAPNGMFDILMERGGGANNATTSSDRTNYFSWGPAPLLPLLLWLEADRMEHLGHAMTQTKLDLQRAVVRNERRQSYENEPYGPSELEVDPIMFPKSHPYHIPVIGTHEDLRAATVQDVKDFFATWYIPNNASLCVAGDFDKSATKKLIADLFGSIPAGKPPVHRTANPVALKESVSKVMTDDNVESTRVSLVWHSPAHHSPGDAECDILSRVLADGLTSRLQKRLMVDSTMVQSVAAMQASARLGSQFRIDALVSDGVAPDAVIKVIDEEIAAVAKDGPTPAEMTRIRNKLEMEFVSGIQRVRERADLLNGYDALFGTPDGFERDLDRYRQATAEGVRTIAESFLVKAHRLTLTVNPSKKKNAAVETEDDDETLGATPESAPAPWKPETPSPRDTMPAQGARKAFVPPQPLPLALEGGIGGWMHPRNDLPLVGVVLRVPGGNVLEPKGKAGLAALVSDLLREGAGERDALAFTAAMDELGASFDVSVDSDSINFQLLVLKSNFPAAAALLLDAILKPRFDEAAFTRLKTQAIAAVKRRDERADRVASMVAGALLFPGGHPFGIPDDGSVASLSSITRDDVVAFWNEHRKQGVQILAGGAVTADEVAAVFAKPLAALPKGGSTLKPFAPYPAVERGKEMRTVIVDRKGAPQTVVFFAWPVATYGTSSRLPMSLGSVILGGSFTSRLNQNLRERQGFTYGASARVAYYPGEKDPASGPAWGVASSSVRADATGASVREFMNEFARMRQGDITADELEKARETWFNAKVTQGEAISGLFSEFDALVSFGMPPSKQADDMKIVAALDLKTVNDVAKAQLHPEGGVLVLVGDAASIMKQLEAVGVKGATVVDPATLPELK